MLGLVEWEIRYARNGNVALAYEIIGDGPIDLVCLAPANNLEIVWENPLFARYLRRLASFARVVLMDRRGTGLSDRFSPEDLPPLEDLVDDIGVVLDAMGSKRAVLFGFSDAGSQCAMFAATRPERVVGLILYASAACGVQRPDYPWQWSEEAWQSWLKDVETRYGTAQFSQEWLPSYLPSHVGDGRIERWMERHWRLAASPNSMLAIESVYNRHMDIRPLLPVIGIKTLVMHRTDDQIEPVGAGRYIADHIPAARFVELPGGDHFPWAGDQDALIDEVERFMGEVLDSEEVSDRVLATVLFTDIVESTEKASMLGDMAWTALLARHDELARGEIERFRGRYINTTGDGLLATFDGPARAVRCAKAIAETSRPLGLEIRSGCHTGEVELVGDDVQGLAVHIAARVAALAGASEVWTSSTVRDLTFGSGISFEETGEHELKGVPSPWRLFRVAA